MVKENAAFKPHVLTDLKLILRPLVNEKAVFKFLVLTAMRFATSNQGGSPVRRSKKRASPAPRCALALLTLLRGHEGSVLRHIADFSGVVRRRGGPGPGADWGVRCNLRARGGLGLSHG